MWEKFVGVIEQKIEAEGRELTKILRSLENFVLTVKQILKQNTFWNRIIFETKYCLKQNAFWNRILLEIEYFLKQNTS